MCIQYLASCLRCQADIKETIIKCPWTDIPGNCLLCRTRELTGLATICIDCWLSVNTEYLLDIEKEQLAQEIKDTKVQEKYQKAVEKQVKEAEKKIKDNLGWEQWMVDGELGERDRGWERWIVNVGTKDRT
jgi:hypothetical protein